LLDLGDFVEVVVGVVDDGPVGGRVLGGLRSVFGGDEAVTPVVILLRYAVGRGAGGVIDDLGQVAVTDGRAAAERVVVVDMLTVVVLAKVVVPTASLVRRPRPSKVSVWTVLVGSVVVESRPRES
jgi:hypothetical protein